MGGCMSVCEKLFPSKKNKVVRKQKQESTYLDATFKRIKKPLLGNQQDNEEDIKMNRRDNEGNDGQINKKKESISIEMQERRIMIEKQKELEEIEKEENDQYDKRQKNNLSFNSQHQKEQSNIQQKNSLRNKHQSIDVNSQGQKQVLQAQADSNSILKPKQQRYDQQKQQHQQQEKQQLQNSSLKSNSGQNSSSLSTYDQGETKDQKDILDQKNKQDSYSSGGGKDEFKSQKKEHNLMNNIQNSTKNDKHSCSTFYKYKETSSHQGQFKDQMLENHFHDDDGNNEALIELDEFKNEKYKHIDQNKEIYLLSLKDDDNLRTKDQSNDNGEVSNIERELILKDEDDQKQKEDDEEDQRQKEEKLKEVRKSIQRMSLNKNQIFHHQGSIYHQQFQHVQHSHHFHPISANSLNQEGQPKISNIPFSQFNSIGQNLNYYCGEEDLSLLLFDSKKNSLFYGNFPHAVKDSMFVLDESIIHPIKPTLNGGTNYNGEYADSDTSSKREEEWAVQMKKQQSTHDLVNLLSQGQQNQQQNLQSSHQIQGSQSSENIIKKVSIQLENKEGKIHKQKEDLLEYDKNKQNNGSNENIKFALNNQISNQLSSQNSQNSIGSQIKKDNQQQSQQNDELVLSRKNSSNSLKKSANNKINYYDKNKSPQNTENPKLVTIKEEEIKAIGENSIQLPINQGDQNNFSFSAEQQNQHKQEEQNKNIQATSDNIIQNTEYSETINNKEQSLNEKKKQNLKNNEIDEGQQQSNYLQQQQSQSKEQESLQQTSLNRSIEQSPEKQDSMKNKEEYSPSKQSSIQSKRKFSQSQVNLQDGLDQLQNYIQPFSSRYSLRQPQQKLVYNRSESGDISIVVQDPKNIMTEQLIFSIHPVNSKIQLNQNASSSQRDSVRSNYVGPNREKSDSVNNRNLPHRSLLENTNRVVMQKRTSRKLINQQPFQQQTSIFSQEQGIVNLDRQDTFDKNKESNQNENIIQDKNNNIDSEDFVYMGIHSNKIIRNEQDLNAYNNMTEISECQDDHNEQLNSKNNSMNLTPFQRNANKSQSVLEQNVRQFEEEMKQMKQDQTYENEQIEEEKNNNLQPTQELDNNVIHVIRNRKKYSESFNNIPPNEDGELSSNSSPYIKPASHGNSQRTSYRNYNVQNFNLNKQNSQKYHGNETPFHSCNNTPMTSKRPSQNVEPKGTSSSEQMSRKSISGNKRVSYYKEANSAVNQYYDCDNYQVQIINSDEFQNKDLLEQPELYMQWIETLSEVQPEIFSSEAIYQFEMIKQETYQDFLYKFEQEYHYNLELFDSIYQSNNQNIYFRSELGLDQERLFVITGEYYVNTSSYAAFYNFKNSFNIQQALNNFDYIYSVNDDLQNTVIYANCSSKYLQKPCEFVFLKHFSFLQQNVEMQRDNQDQLIQPVEQMCEIDISLNSEEIEQYIKKNKKQSNRGEIFSGNIATFIPELNQIKVEIMIEHNFHNLLNSSQAKSMYTEMFKNYFKKLNSAFS